jgi:AcrR family transcriptional regulator
MAIRKQPAATSRPRNAQATRTAILEAARACFTEGGYEHVGVRDVATRAGVNGALVIRYFGSKMKLFAEALAGRFAFDSISDGHALDGNRMARVVLERKERGGRVNAVLALVRSAPDPQAAAILKRGLEDDFIKPLAASLHGRQAHQRAALITAYLLGLAIARDVVGVGALADSADEALLALVAPVIQSYIDPAGTGVRARKASAPNYKGDQY